MKITTIGIDLAKSVFQIHGADAQGKAILRQQLKRAQMLPFFARMQPCKVAMEACGSVHYWARKLQALGFDVRLIAPQYVKPYIKRNKNDVADAEAIREAATRPEMPKVPVKTASQQAMLSVHRARQGFVKARTAQANQIRGLLAEFGLVPRQHSSGGKPTLLGISKRGDSYLRTLLIHGARAVVRVAGNKPEANGWVQHLLARRHKNVAAVALANKNVRIVWALLVHDRRF